MYAGRIRVNNSINLRPQGGSGLPLAAEGDWRCFPFLLGPGLHPGPFPLPSGWPVVNYRPGILLFQGSQGAGKRQARQGQQPMTRPQQRYSRAAWRMCQKVVLNIQHCNGNQISNIPSLCPLTVDTRSIKETSEAAEATTLVSSPLT